MKTRLFQAIALAILPAVLGCGEKERNPYLATVRLEQVLVRPVAEQSNFEKVEPVAESVLKKLRGGADFSEMVRQYSTFTGASAEGSLSITRGWMDPAFEEAVFAMPDKSLSDLVRTPKAFYIVYRDSSQYLQVRTSHILIKSYDKKVGDLGERGVERARKKIWEVYALLQQGKNFFDVARENSEDESSAQQGGDIGWKKRNTMVREFEEVAFRQEPGQVSKPVQTAFGYHIIRTVQKKDLKLFLRLIEFKVPIGEQDTQRARLLLEEAHRKALAGKNFQALADSYAVNPEAVFKYNEPYEVKKTLLLPELAAEVDKMEPGEISRVLKDQDGYYFFRLIKK